MIRRALLVVGALACACACACKKDEPAAQRAPEAPVAAPADAAPAPVPERAPVEPLLKELADVDVRIDRATVEIGKATSKADADAAVTRLEALRAEKQAIERKIYEARQRAPSP